MKTILRLVLWGFAFVGLLAVLGIGGLITIAVQEGAPRETPSAFSLVIDLNGGVIDGAGGGDTLDRLTFGAQTPLSSVVLALRTAAEDEKVKGLLVLLGDAPLGVAQAQELRGAVETFRASGKPAVAFAEDIGGLGGGSAVYYLASAFDEVWLQPSGGVGLTALAMESPFLGDALTRLGVEAAFSRRHEYKSAPEMFTETAFTPEARSTLTALLNSWSEQIAVGVARSRKLETARVKALMDDGPFLATEALDNKLIDKLGYGDEARAALAAKAGTGERLGLAAYGGGNVLTSAVEKSLDDAKVIALIHATGQIVRNGTQRMITPDALVRALNAAADDPEIAAIVLRIDSPGGDYVAADSIWRAAMLAKEKKPLIASIGDMAASGGYFIAMAADKIVAQPGSLTGSIGAFAGKFVLSGLFDDLGVTWDRVETGPNAGMYSMTRPFSPAQQAKFEAMLDAVYADFTDKAARARGMTGEEIDRVARGRVFSGIDAKAAGLVDELGGIDAAVALAREAAAIPSDQEIAVRPYPPSDPFDLLRELLGGQGPIGILDVIAPLLRAADWLARADARMSGRAVLLAPTLP